MRKRKIAKLLIGCALACSLFAGVGVAHAQEQPYEVVYTGSQSDFTVSGSELFSLVDNGLPGDVFVGSLNITNESGAPCEVFVHAQDVVAKGPDDMLERIPVTLQANGQDLFEGRLDAIERLEPTSLGIVEAGGSVTANYMAVIPAELTNEYADAAVGMNVAVSLTEQEEGGIGLVQTGANAGKGVGLVQTGDLLVALPFILGALTAAGTVIWCAWKRRMRMW